MVLPYSSFAQFETATVLGTVKDGTGAVIVGAKVSLENVKTGVVSTTQSNEAGNYDFLAVQIGLYRLRAEAPGFKIGIAADFTVAVSSRQRMDLTLEVGNVTESVSVKDTAALLETDSSDRGQVINNTTVVNLPLNGRNYSDLALLAPGVRKSFLGMDPNSSNFREGSFNVNGQRSAFNNFQVDGVDNNAYNTSNQGYSNQAIQLSPDAVAEFKVQTNNFSAEYGRAGGAIVNVSLKSGTNAFHGAMWEFVRNTKLNAVGFFKPANGKPVFQQNQFGGVIGGPVIKNKTFFFADYEGLRRKTATLSYLTVPTIDQRNGIFKGMSIENPYTGELYTDGVIPKSLITAFAAKVFSQLPAPTTSGASNNYQAMPSIPSVENKGDARVDHYFSSKATAYFRYSHREFNQTDNPLIPLPLGSDSNNGYVNIINKQTAGGVTYTLTPTSLLEFRMGYTQSTGGKWPVQMGMPNMQDAYGIPGLPTDASIAGGLNTQAITGYLNLGRRSSTPQFQNPTVINPKANYTHMFAQHSMKLGYEYQHIDTDVLDFSPQYGQDTYGGQFSAPTGASSNAYNVADFLFGARSAYQLTNVFVAAYRQRMNFLYLQDDWKVSRKLTVNMGVRYEYATPQWEDGNHLSNFVPGEPGKMIAASSGDIYNRALVHPDRNNWAPRFGLAYTPLEKTVIRAGYGISYIHFNRAGGENLLAYNPPSVVTISITNPNPMTAPACAADVANTNCFRSTAQGYTSSILDPSRINYTGVQLRYTPPDTRTGYVQSWHFTVQQQVAKDLLFEAAYVGNHGVKLMTLGDVNQARPLNPGETTTTSPLTSRRRYLGFSDIEISYGGGYSMYHAFQAKLEKRFSGGFYFLNSFTWSKLIDNAAGHLETSNGDNSRVNFLDPGYNKGVGGYNQPFSNTTTVVYALPYGKGRKFGASGHRVLAGIIGGWQATLINTMSSGMPVNLWYSPASTYSVSSYPTYRPNVSGDPMAPSGQRNIDNYFNKANVTIPVSASTPNPFGNVGRNTVRSYAIYQTDLGLHKAFPLRSEVRKIEFRTEFFNLLNKANFQAPNSAASSSAFGTIRSAFPARVIQMALKLVF